MNRILRRLDRIHTNLLNEIGSLDETVFVRSPAADQWSAAEILQHLYLVEEAVTKELERSLAGPPQRLSLLRQLIPTSIVAVRLKRFKGPKSVQPLNPPAREAIIANYNAARDKLKALCAEHGPTRLKQTAFKHPFLGPINGLATVSFIGYHELRHHKQLRETLKKLRKPGNREQ
jgi:hypothetical protein